MKAGPSGPVFFENSVEPSSTLEYVISIWLHGFSWLSSQKGAAVDQVTFQGCFGCGQDNKCGLKATFRTMASGGVEGIFIAEHHHCGYKDSVHVGPLVGLLSETMGRLAFSMDCYYLTNSLHVKFHRAVSPGGKIRAFATIKRHLHHHMTAEAKMYSPEGELVAEAEGKFELSVRPSVKRCSGEPEDLKAGS